MDTTIHQAITAHKDGKLEEAERLYQEILKTHPTHPDANHNLGVVALSKNRTLEALSLFKIATEANPKIEQFWISYANVLINEKKYEEAEKSFKKVIELNPDNARAHCDLGVSLQNLGKLDEAEESCRKAIELKPDYARAHYNLGVIRHQPGRLIEAEASYKRAIELKPDNVQSHNNLGFILKEQGRLDEAEASYRKAIKLKPNYVDALTGLGIVLNELGKLKESETCFKKAIELKPDYAEGHNNLGSLQISINKFDEAEESYRKAIKLKPNYVDALINRGTFLFKRGQYDSALKDFDMCNSPKSRSHSLSTLYALGRTEEIYQRIDAQSKLDDTNLRVSAFSSFIATKEKRETKHNFCKNPIDFIYNSNLKYHLKNSNLFINDLIEELRNIAAYWQPFDKSTEKGFQSIVNIFENSSEILGNLRSIIMNELDLYHLKFKDKDCSFIKKWPSKKNIHGWYVILKQQGYQNAHIHPGGWLSGVIYLKVVPPLDKSEGAIEFSLNGKNYHDPNSPKLIHQPKVGDIVFFPSSLHHRTIPFTTDEDRIIISFDLGPPLES